MSYLPLIFTVAVIHILVVISPGPDFIMILRSSLKYGRRSGIFSAVGLGLGIALHVSYCLAGIALVISRSILLFNIIKYIGAGYLIYIGIKTLRDRSVATPIQNYKSSGETLSPAKSIRLGFITNATNPKATLFFLSLFTLVIQPDTPFWVKSVMGLEMSIATFLWFAALAIAISHRAVRGRISGLQSKAEKVMGGILVLFGLKLATVHTKIT